MSSAATGLRSTIEPRIKTGSQARRNPSARSWAVLLFPSKPKAVAVSINFKKFRDKKTPIERNDPGTYQTELRALEQRGTT